MQPAISQRRIRTSALVVFSWALLMLNMGAAQAGDVMAGKARAGMCVTCHGPLGLSQIPNAPHLAGQPAMYVVEQLKNFRSGKRQNEVMNVMAKPLTDQDIDDLAAWFASIQVSATVQ